MSESRADGGIAPYLRVFATSWRGRTAIGVLAAIAVSVIIWALQGEEWLVNAPLVIATVIVGAPMLGRVARDAFRRRFGADLLGILALITSAALGEWLVASIIALMLSGGEALEAAASTRASQVLEALARRSPTIAHRRGSDGGLTDLDVAGD